MNNINLQINSLRKKRNITQEKLAEHLGVSVQAVSKWETKNSYPDITLLPDIAEYFEVSIDTLLGLHPITKEPKQLYNEIKAYLSNFTRDTLYSATWNISGILHEALCTNGWKSGVNWDSNKNRLLENEYKGWGLSMHLEKQGFTHMTSGFTVIGSINDLQMPQSDDVLGICRLFENFTDRGLVKIIVSWFSYINENGNVAISPKKIASISDINIDEVIKNIDKMIDKSLITESFSPTSKDTLYQLNKGWMYTPLFIIANIFANKMKAK